MAVEPLRILLVDDSPDDLDIATRLLEREFPAVHVERSNTPAQFEAALQAGNFNLVITDFQLQWTDGLAVLKEVKQRYPYRPVIMFTATGTQEVAVQAMKSGLDDYIIKSSRHYARLAASVRRSLQYTEAERHAAELQVRLNMVLARLKIGVYRVDSSGKLLDCSTAFFKLIGARNLQEAQIIYEERFSTPPDLLTLTGKTAVREIEMPRQGEPRWFSVEEVGITNSEDAAAVEGLLQDITDRKRSEHQLRGALREKELLLQERERLLHVKDEFLSMVSHELRTPLNLISGWAQVLLKGNVDARTTERALETIVRNVRSQTQIIDDLTDVAAVITGKLRLDLQEVDVNDSLRIVVEGLQPTARSKNVQLDEYRRMSHPLSTRADPRRLQQIIWNLLSNAIKFTDSGGRVQVDAVQNDDQIVISVRDTGCGITPEFLPRVFDRFSQADSSSTRRKGGLGLGLALVKHLAELHGGTVEAASDGPGRGALFTVRLPAMPHMSANEGVS